MEAAKGGKKGGKKGGNQPQQQKKGQAQPQQPKKGQAKPQQKGQAAPAAAAAPAKGQAKPQQQKKKGQAAPAAAAPAAAAPTKQQKKKGQAAAAAPKEEKAVVAQPPAKKAKADEEQQAEIAELSEAAQKELAEITEAFNKMADEEMKAVAKITREFNGKRKPLLEKRKQVVSKIPGFWLQALANTPAAGLINDKDAEVFQYLKDISVIEPTDDEADKAKADDDFKIVFTFDKNPFFANKQLWKEVKYVGEDENRELKVTGSPINWNKGKNPNEKKAPAKEEAGKQKGKRAIEEVDEDDEDEGTFFDWFTSTEDETVELGEWFRDKFCPQAVGYFMGDVSDDEDDSDLDELDSEEEAEFARLAGLNGGDDDDDEDGDE